LKKYFTKQSLRVASRFACSRAAALKVQSRSAQTFPRLGTEAEMQAEAIEQIRARVLYQKEMTKINAHDPAEELAEMYRWINITFWVGIPVCALSAFYSYFFDEHPHRHEGALPDYMQVRTKEFPWECGECDLFDAKCWAKCRAEKAAEKA
jgi:cytochrome c oxidase subunit 6a